MNLLGEDSEQEMQEIQHAQIPEEYEKQEEMPNETPITNQLLSKPANAQQYRYFNRATCDFCCGSHETYTCYKRERDQFCYNCGDTNHRLYECKLRNCTFCGGRHDSCGNIQCFQQKYELACFRCGAANHFSFLCQCMNQNQQQTKKIKTQNKQKQCIYCGNSSHTVSECSCQEKWEILRRLEMDKKYKHW